MQALAIGSKPAGPKVWRDESKTLIGDIERKSEQHGGLGRRQLGWWEWSFDVAPPNKKQCEKNPERFMAILVGSNSGQHQKGRLNGLFSKRESEILK